MNTRPASQHNYPYEEFADHIRAMKMVRDWEYTSRFGHLGHEQDGRAANARVLEYFADCYADQREAIHKAELFLSINDFLGRHTSLFTGSDLLELSETGVLLVEPCLLRAIHHVFTVAPKPEGIPPKKILALAKAFKDIDSLH